MHGSIGLKDLMAFKFAMLGIQGWMFQTNSYALVSRIFKAKYFYHDTFMSSSLGYNSNYVWISI